MHENYNYYSRSYKYLIIHTLLLHLNFLAIILVKLLTNYTLNILLIRESADVKKGLKSLINSSNIAKYFTKLTILISEVDSRCI